MGNVSTALAVCRAVYDGITCYERAVTDNGQGNRPTRKPLGKNGHEFRRPHRYCGGLTDDVKKLISGGPMMGFAVPNADIYVTKTSGCVLALSDKEAYADRSERVHKLR